ncbi:MAG: N-acetylmuramic acid 6-phosphate etherase [Armatimonadetes bacterium]|nr:N-acetylmuramic acid 6-phosphate etherase [Armatimonadota bacterium]
MGDLDSLITEQPNPAAADLDNLPLVEALARMNAEDARVPAAVGAEIPRIAAVVERVVAALRAGGRLIYVGAGSSGRLGCLDAAEMPPTFGVPPDMVIGVIAGGDAALRRSGEAEEDDPAAGAGAMAELGVGPKDVVGGLAASGRTPYVLGALREAARRGAFTFGVSTNRPCEMESACNVLIAPDAGPEVLAGSTRLKAGTAQKLVLNMISTLAMARLGKTYGNLMVDVRPSNEKLRRRALRLVRTVGEVDEAEAARLLKQAGGEVKVAILMGRAGLDAATARARLAAAGGFLRAALETQT